MMMNEGNKTVVQLLLGNKKLGVDVDTENCLRETPLELAKGNHDITKLLLFHGATVKTLSALPDELILHIFSFVRNMKDLCTLSMVSKSFHVLCSDDLLWQHFGSPLWQVPKRYALLPSPKENYPTRTLSHISCHANRGWKDQCKEESLRKASLSFKQVKLAKLNSSSGTRILKLMVIGNSGVGKTSLIHQYLYGTLDHPLPPNEEEKEKDLEFDGLKIKVNNFPFSSLSCLCCFQFFMVGQYHRQ